MHRFFVPEEWLQGNRAEVRGPQARQIARVLRMRPGDGLVLLDNSGWEIEVQLTSVAQELVTGRVLHRRLSGGEPRTKISLYQGVLRHRHFELVLQKCTELGAVEFVPTITDRCVVSDLDAVDKKHRRWEWIIQEAAEQCRRARKPTLRPALLFPQACEEAMHSGGLSILLWEGEGEAGLGALLRDVLGDRGEAWPPFSVNLFIGPEGGFTVDEITIAQRYGLVPATLGERILRAETAGIAATAAILFALGDLG
jgi:16S rRNA (uracil1498-N3)-methyltransferase